LNCVKKDSELSNVNNLKTLQKEPLLRNERY
jgi:hypothetical protein